MRKQRRQMSAATGIGLYVRVNSADKKSAATRDILQETVKILNYI
jgi:hypothetical protein